MKSKGFTIIELLAIIIIIGLIVLLITPAVNNLIENSENKSYNFQIKSIEDAAINFSIEYGNSITDLDSFTIDLKLLKDLAFIDFDIRNPKTNKYFSDDTLITLTKNKGSYKASVIDYDSTTIDENVKYKDYIILIKSGDVSTSNVVVLNFDGIKLSDYSVTNEVGSTILEGYTTNIYNVIVDGNNYRIVKLDRA